MKSSHVLNRTASNLFWFKIHSLCNLFLVLVLGQVFFACVGFFGGKGYMFLSETLTSIFKTVKTL